MDDLAALRLLIEWGADEALADEPQCRLAPAAPPRPSAPVPPAARAPTPAAPTPASLAPTTLDDLHATLDALDHPLRATATTTVRPSGNPAAGLVFVAEAPGRDDDRAGDAFAGPPGQALDTVLASAGLDRTRLLLAFIVPWRPPGERPPSPQELAACLPHLHRLLVLARPRHLVLLGQGPLRALTPLQALRPARGRWTTASIPGLPEPIPALPMLSPDQWRKNAATRASTWCDLLVLLERLATD